MHDISKRAALATLEAFRDLAASSLKHTKDPIYQDECSQRYWEARADAYKFCADWIRIEAGLPKDKRRWPSE